MVLGFGFLLIWFLGGAVYVLEGSIVFCTVQLSAHCLSQFLCFTYFFLFDCISDCCCVISLRGFIKGNSIFSYCLFELQKALELFWLLFVEFFSFLAVFILRFLFLYMLPLF